jgi:hypothetical protein
VASGRAADVYDRGDGTVLRSYRIEHNVADGARVMRWLADQGHPVVHATEGRDLVMRATKHTIRAAAAHRLCDPDISELERMGLPALVAESCRGGRPSCDRDRLRGWAIVPCGPSGSTSLPST